MIIVCLLIGVIIIYILYGLQNSWRMPIYNKVYNMWQEDTEKVTKANLAIIIMCFISFLLGVISNMMIN
jgi:uncharacterized membrane protein